MNRFFKMMMVNSGWLSTPDLYLTNLSNTAITAYWSPGADSYEADIATDAAFTSIVGSYSGGASTTTFSGLTIDTLYYFRVRAFKSGYQTSNYKTQSGRTFSFTPNAFYLPAGLQFGSNNEYGQAASSSWNIDFLKSIVNTGGPQLNRNVGAPYGIMRQSTFYPYQSFLGGNGYYDAASDWTLSGNFYIAWEMACPPGGGNRFVFSRVGGNDNVFFLSGLTACNVNLNGTNYTVFFTAPLVAGTIYKFVLRRIGSDMSISIDGGLTFSGSSSTPGTTITVSTANFILNRMFASGVGGNIINVEFFRLLFYSGGSLTQAQLDDVFEYIIPDYLASFAPDSNSTNVKGLTYSNLTDGRWSDLTSAADNSDSFSRQTSWVIGDKAVIASSKISSAPDYSQSSLRAFNILTGQGSNVVNLDVLQPIDNVHNIGSLYPWNDRLYHFQHDNHYGNPTTTLRTRATWKGFNFVGIQDIPNAKGVSKYVMTNGQYTQITNIGNTLYAIVQEYITTFPRRLVLLTGRDFSYWDTKWNVVDFAAAPNWPYNYVVYNGTRNELHLFIVHYDSAAVKYRYLTHVMSTDGGTTWRNIDNSFSKNVRTAGALTIAELTTNCLVFSANALAENAAFGNALITASGEIYGTVSNGLGTAWQMFIGQVGSAGWTLRTIGTGGKTIITNTTPSAVGSAVSGFNRSYPVIWKNSSNNYSVAACEVNGGNWRLIELNTIDAGLNWTYIQDLTPTSDTEQYVSPQVCRNYEFASYGVLTATRAITSTTGNRFVKRIK